MQPVFAIASSLAKQNGLWDAIYAIMVLCGILKYVYEGLRFPHTIVYSGTHACYKKLQYGCGTTAFHMYNTKLD